MNDYSLLFSVPILNHGFVEGALVAELDFNVEDILPARDLVRRTEIVAASDGSAQTLTLNGTANAPLAGTNLWVSIEPDRASVTLTSRAFDASHSWHDRPNPYIRLSIICRLRQIKHH